MENMDIRDNLKTIHSRISRAQEQSLHSGKSVEIVAVTKKFDASVVEQAIDSGLGTLGENRIQEAEGKFRQIGNRAAWHLIGHLQRNKAGKAVEIFDLIHSVDSVALAENINRRAESTGKIQNILVQVNTSGEETKFGVNPEDTESLLMEIKDLKNINIQGLMTIGPFVDDMDLVRNCFKQLRELKDDLNRKNITPDQMIHLSMGMSNDYEIAVEEGATLLRLGTVIFGPRQY